MFWGSPNEKAIRVFLTLILILLIIGIHVVQPMVESFIPIQDVLRIHGR